MIQISNLKPALVALLSEVRTLTKHIHNKLYADSESLSGHH